MIRFVKGIIGGIIALLILAFSIANDEKVTIIWSPFHEDLTIHLFIVAIAGLGLGFFLGGFIVWLNGSQTRRERRRLKKEVKALNKDIESLRAELSKANPETIDSLPEPIEG